MVVGIVSHTFPGSAVDADTAVGGIGDGRTASANRAGHIHAGGAGGLRRRRRDRGARCHPGDIGTNHVRDHQSDGHLVDPYVSDADLTIGKDDRGAGMRQRPSPENIDRQSSWQ